MWWQDEATLPQLVTRFSLSYFNNTALQGTQSQSAAQFAASLVTGIVTFSVQVLVFLFLKDRLARIYAPRTYLVPPRERTDAPHPGWFAWVRSVLSTSNSEFVQKCGLDAYFFLRYLRTLLKIFVPAACFILPVLLPLNASNGRGGEWAIDHPSQSNVTGLNQLAWGNIKPDNYRRYWAHWLMALFFIIWICYVVFVELRNYIRMRQAYITSPQHRLRASATTVLVSSIPPKWCTVEALDGLYDVFPGGIRNIWINRNYDELNDKVQLRDQIALQLEGAETELVKKCFKKNEENITKAAKEAGTKLTKSEKKSQAQARDESGRETAADGDGVTTGDPHQVKHTIQEQLEQQGVATEGTSTQKKRVGGVFDVPVLGDGLHVVTEQFDKFGRRLRGGALGVSGGVNHLVSDTNGFMTEGTTAHDAATTNYAAQSPSTNGAHIVVPATHDTHGQIVHPKSPLDFEPQSATTQPHENDREPLKHVHPISPVTSTSENEKTKAYEHKTRPLSVWQKFKALLGVRVEPEEEIEYPSAFENDLVEDDKSAKWQDYIEAKDRDTHRLPIFGWQWMISLPLIGEKVDTIYWCRKELARLNVEIEEDQANSERFPLMNSAFIQFNHQIAAHMACQSLSHHLPKQMDPRLVEIDPKDVIWENMSIPWWQNYLRTAGVIATVVGLIILWAIPIAFTSALSNLTLVAKSLRWTWITRIPSWVIGILQGVLPIALLGLLLFLLPLILRYLAKLEGTKSGMLIELSVQKYYFFFVFVQIFLVVTIFNSATSILSHLSVAGISELPQLFGQSIPMASNYFFSYMLLQALSVSSGALLQIGSLIVWFLLSPILDSTARDKFKRQTNLSNIQWGTFFPVYTNLACIGIIYSIISPLILLFNIITFSLFWFVYRYNTLYVNRFTLDTGGLLYPNAINCTFTGVYVLEVALIGLFFLVENAAGEQMCKTQAILMIVILVLTAVYQILLNNAFSPLYRYMPITLEDDAVRRDEEFARALRHRHKHDGQHENLIENERPDEDIEDQLENNERKSLEDDKQKEEYEMQQIEHEKSAGHKRVDTDDSELADYETQNPEITLDDVDRENRTVALTKNLVTKAAEVLPALPSLPIARGLSKRKKSSWADRSDVKNRRSAHFGRKFNQNESDNEISQSQSRPGSQPEPQQISTITETAESDPSGHLRPVHHRHGSSQTSSQKLSALDALDKINAFNPLVQNKADLEAQRLARAELSDALYAGVNDELEDLSAEQRDALVQRAFQHSALRARRPVIWIPRDELGISDDEVVNIGRFSKGNIWVSNVRQGLDSKGRTVYSGAPPDFSEVDLINL